MKKRMMSCLLLAVMLLQLGGIHALAEGDDVLSLDSQERTEDTSSSNGTTPKDVSSLLMSQVTVKQGDVDIGEGGELDPAKDIIVRLDFTVPVVGDHYVGEDPPEGDPDPLNYVY